MAERAPRLEWRDAEAFSEAYAGPLYLLAGQGEWELYGSHEDGVLVARGPAVSRDAGKVAAEASALAWLSEGVAALGGRVLEAGEVGLVGGALSYLAADREHCMFTDEFDMCDAAVALARKLGGE